MKVLNLRKKTKYPRTSTQLAIIIKFTLGSLLFINNLYNINNN